MKISWKLATKSKISQQTRVHFHYKMEFDRDHENSDQKVSVGSPLPTESPTSLKSEDDIDAGIAILNPSVRFDYNS